MIRNILFDIGVVLLHLDYRRGLAKFLPLCDPARSGPLASFFSFSGRDPVIADYERGRVSPQELYRQFVAATGFRGSFEQFAELTMDILAENKPMIDYARTLAPACAVYLATNTGSLQISRMYDAFPSLRFFKDAAVSCYLGEVKPDRAFYEKALARFRVAAGTCLFVDDRPENVAGAEACGIRSVLYTTPGETIAAVDGALARGKR